MKTKFQVNDIVKITNIDNLDVYNPETDEQDVFLFDDFKILEVIEHDEDESDLLVESLRFKTQSIINSERFILA